MNGSKLARGLFLLAVVVICGAAVPVAAQLGLLWLYLEPNPRHLPPVLTGEANGWAIIGLLTGAAVVIVAETITWQSGEGFWARRRGLIIGAVIALVASITLGIFFAIIQMDSVDGQAMETRQLAVLAGATASGLATLVGIVGGAVIRSSVVSAYRLPDSHPSRITFNDEDASGFRRGR